MTVNPVKISLARTFKIPLTPLKRGKLNSPFSRGLGGFLDFLFFKGNILLKIK
jgi:hypothetical protein